MLKIFKSRFFYKIPKIISKEREALIIKNVKRKLRKGEVVKYQLENIKKFQIYTLIQI